MVAAGTAQRHIVEGNEAYREQSVDISVSLPPDLAAFIRSKVEAGRYASAGDVIREALAMMESADRLRVDWNEGVASGDGGPLDFPGLRAEARRRRDAGTRRA